MGIAGKAHAVRVELETGKGTLSVPDASVEEIEQAIARHIAETR